MACDDVREFDERELEKFSHLEFAEIGIARALDYCAEHSITPPHWVVQEANELLIRLLRGDKPHRKGRLANYVTQFGQELRDTERWSAVKSVQEIRAAARGDDKVLARLPEKPETEILRRTHAKRKAWLKRDNFECAADLLCGYDAYATPSAIKRSYRRIENKRKHERGRLGAWFSESFLKKLGLEQIYERRPGHKTFLFIDLPKRKPKQHSATQGIASGRIDNEHRKSTKKALGKAGR